MYQPIDGQQPQPHPYYQPNQIMAMPQPMLPQPNQLNPPSLTFSTTSKTFSGICTALETAANVVFLYFIVKVITTSIYDQFQSNGMFWIIMGIGFAGGIFFVRFLMSIWYCCQPNSTSNEKTAVALHVIAPGLKYLVIRQNLNYQGKLLVLLRNDLVCHIYLFFVALCGILAFMDSVVFDEDDGYSQDMTFAYFACAALLSEIFGIISILIHRRWIKYYIQIEKIRLLQQAMMPLLMNQGIINTQPMNVNPYNQNNRPNDESIVVGQPVQPNPYYQPYSPVGVPQQPGN